MTQNNTQMAVRPGSAMPRFRNATFADVRASLSEGLSDFLAHPLYGLVFGGIYAVGGIVILYIVTWVGAPWMIIPLAIGFPLVAPFVAVGLYEISRRRAAGEPVTPAGVFAHVFRQRERQLGWMAFVVLFVFWIWVYQVRLLFAIFLGFKSFSTWFAFYNIVTTTPEGWGFLVVGTLVGTVLATILFSTTVLALPLLMEREIDFVSAMIASVSAVIASPAAMLGFGAIVGAAALVSLIPAFLGLVVVLPVLGHATWRLYARLSVPQ